MSSSREKNINIAMSLTGADPIKQNLKQIRSATEEFGDAGKKAAEGLTSAFEKVEKADENLLAKIGSGAKITSKDGAIMLQQFELLKTAVESAFGSISRAPEEIQAAYKKAEAQFERTTKKVREITDAVDDQKDTLKEGGVAWGGFADGLNKVIGPAGGAQVKFLAVAAALKEGWQIGTDFARAIGTDFSTMESAAANLKSSIAGVINALVTDGPVASIQQWVASLKTLNNSINGDGDALKGFNTLVEAGVPRTDALKVATADLTRVQQLHAVAVAAGANGVKEFNELVQTTNPAQLVSALESLRTHWENAAKAAAAAAEAEKKRQDAVRDTISSIDSEVAALERERQARKLGLDELDAEITKRAALKDALEKAALADRAAADVKNGLSESLRSELEHLAALLPHYENNTAKIEAMSAALKSDIDLYRDGLSPERRKELEALSEQLGKLNDLDFVQRGFVQAKIEDILRTSQQTTAVANHNVTLDKTKGTISNVSDETSKLGNAQGNLAAAFEKTLGPASSASEHITTLRDLYPASTENAAAYNKELDAMAENLQRIATWGKEAAKAIDAFEQASQKAAGVAQEPGGATQLSPDQRSTPGWNGVTEAP